MSGIPQDFTQREGEPEEKPFAKGKSLHVAKHRVFVTSTESEECCVWSVVEA